MNMTWWFVIVGLTIMRIIVLKLLVACNFLTEMDVRERRSSSGVGRKHHRLAIRARLPFCTTHSTLSSFPIKLKCFSNVILRCVFYYFVSILENVVINLNNHFIDHFRYVDLVVMSQFVMNKWRRRSDQE